MPRWVWLSSAALFGILLGCHRTAIDLEDYERACAAYCETRFACIDIQPWLTPEPPTDVDDCTERCVGELPDDLECMPTDSAYHNCLAALSCEELKVLYDDGPYSEAARELCFVEFEDASFCE